MNRKQALAKIWRDTHRDYKGVMPDGVRTIMIYRNGTCLVALDDLTDAEICSRVPEYTDWFYTHAERT